MSFDMDGICSDMAPSWLDILSTEFDAPYFLKLKDFLIEDSKKYVIYPDGKNIFSAFDHTQFQKVKVVILGQDPYHGVGQAHGMCFSVPQGVKIPPSLVNIYKELKSDLGLSIPTHGNLTKWADQGVFLLNATLTVRADSAGSHQKKGWEQFTDVVIKNISDRLSGVVFLLWGNYAKAKTSLIDLNKHHVLVAAHPSPLSAYNGFYGCKHFSLTNNFLIDSGRKPIDWQID